MFSSLRLSFLCDCCAQISWQWVIGIGVAKGQAMSFSMDGKYLLFAFGYT
jgi:hypothetical protein